MIKVSVNVDLKEKDILLPRLRYTLDFIRNHPCAPQNVIWTINETSADIYLGYGQSARDGVIPWVPFCFSPAFKHFPAHTSVQLGDFKIFGFAPESDSLASIMAIDVFQTIFFHISRFEEWQATPTDFDRHGMMSSDLQWLVRMGIQDIPVADHLVFALYQCIGLQPQKLTTRYTISHDVDAIRRLPSFYKFSRAVMNSLWYQKEKLSTLWRLGVTYYRVLSGFMHDPYDTFDWLLDTHHSLISGKYIYFLSGGKTRYENFFDIQDKNCLSIFEKARREGYTLGIHPSYMAGDNVTMTQKEKNDLEKVLNHPVYDSRQHFLRYQIPETGQILENQHIKTDSSFGYRNKTGFRCGTGFPYKMYHFGEERPYSFTELPLVVMDMAIIHQVGWNAHDIISHLKEFLDKNKYYTHITFNFHNSSFDPILFDPEPLKEYYISLFKEQ